MSLTSGTRVGPYEIVAPLGAGGMGEVYRARDPRLSRDVAVKALASGDALDSERIARFEREARTLATLNHPHIAALYGIEDVEAPGLPRSRFIVLELLEGGTLADRLRRGPLPTREALEVARQVADALHAAHEGGIVHRDLKPANIAFTAGGHAKVLDFGLAKSMTPIADAETGAFGATASGVVLGTAAYMSPEQARALPVDKRTDVWALGCVCFEMLAGRHPFAASTLSDVIQRVLNDDPDWAALPAGTPTRVQWLLRRCLEKDPRRRLHDMADARIELEEALMDSGRGERGPLVAPAGPPPPTRLASWERLAWLVMVVTAIAAAIFAWTSRPTPGSAVTASSPPIVAAIPLPEGLTLAGEDPARFALSPDGSKLAFVATSGTGRATLWVRQMNAGTAQSVAGTEGASHPFWSPDSQSVGFVARPAPDVVGGVRGQLKQVHLERGAVTHLANVDFVSTAAWSRDGVILFTPAGNAPLHRIPATGGTPVPATTLDAVKGDAQHSYPDFLPDGRHFVYSAAGSAARGVTDVQAIYLAELGSSDPPRLLVEGGMNGRYAAGHLLFVRDGTLFAQPFALDRLALDGQSVPLAQQVFAGGTGAGVSAAFSVSQTGMLVYQTLAPVKTQLTWFNRSGRQIATLGDPAVLGDVVLSPDDSRLAASVRDTGLGTLDIWVYDVARGLSERATTHRDSEYAPVWSPDGRTLAYSATRDGSVELYQQLLNGKEERLDQGTPGLGKFAASWSPDGQWILHIAGARTIARSDLMLLPLAGDRKPVPYLTSDAIETQARFSPDGRWVAYAATTTGRIQVYVAAFPTTGPPTRISIDSGRWPVWQKHGDELYYVEEDNRIMAVPLKRSGATVTVGKPQHLFSPSLRRMPRLDAYPYDVTDDGQRFIVNIGPGDAAPSITLVQSWPSILRQ